MANPIRERQETVNRLKRIDARQKEMAKRRKAVAKRKAAISEEKKGFVDKVVKNKFSEGGSRGRRVLEENTLTGDVPAVRGAVRLGIDAVKGVEKARKVAKVAKRATKAVAKSKSIRRSVGRAGKAAVSLGKRTVATAAALQGAGMASTALEAALKSKLKQPSRLGRK